MKKLLFIFVAISVVSLSIGGFLMKSVGQNELQSFADKLVAKHFRITQTTPAEEAIDSAVLDSVVVNSTSSDVSIMESEDDKIHVLYAKSNSLGEGEKVYHIVDRKIFFEVPEYSNENLRVKVSEDKAGLNFNFRKAGFIVQLPKKINDLQLKSVSGKLLVDLSKNALPKFKLNAVTTSGDIKLSADTLDKAVFETTSGDVKAFGFLNDIEADSVSGDVKLTTANGQIKAKLTTVSGEVSAFFSSPANLKIAFASLSGEIQIKDRKKVLKSEKSGEFTLGKGIGTLDIKTTSGDAKVKSITEN
ncbi:MAG: DUF4097 family beta strand repeat-containing protein [Pseudobdellovibrio sp.]